MFELDAGGRLDLAVYNEATAWTLSSRQLLEQQPCSDDEPWDDHVRSGRLIAQMLHQDDPFDVRVVLGDLTPEEEGEWIARASWWLQVPDGVLVVAAGGEWSWGWVDDPEEDEFTHLVRIRPGDYRVDLLTTLTSVNGFAVLEQAGHEEPLGAWWRRTRPDTPMPDWLVFALLEHLSEDPGHEDEWEGWSYARHSAVMDRLERSSWIDWIVQLRPLEDDRPEDLPELDEGCFFAPALRVPEDCPTGLVGQPANAEEFSEPSPQEPVEVLEAVAGLGLVDVTGGPVEIAAADVEFVARIAWFADRDVDGEVLLDDRGRGVLGDWAEAHLPTDDLHLRTAPDGRMRLSFGPSQMVHDLLVRLRRLAPAFGALPDGVEVELVTSAGDDDPGRTRFAGTVTTGRWAMERAAPAVDADTLRAAIDLAAESEGEVLALRSDQEAEALRAWWRQDGMQRIAPLELDGLAVGHDEGGRFTLQVAHALFAVRFGDTWPCVAPEDPLEEFDLGIDLDTPLSEALAEVEIPFDEPFLVAESGRVYVDAGPYLPDDLDDATTALVEALEATGAVAVGDLVCDISPAVLMRGVAEKKARWYGTVMVAPFREPVLEAYSRLDDGSSLTTSNNSFFAAAPEAGIHWNQVPATADAASLVAAHLARLEALASERATEVVLLRQNLLGLAEAIEEFLTRRLGR